VAALRALGSAGVATGPRLAHFELALLRELGYGPALESCVACAAALDGRGLYFSASGGGVLCRACRNGPRDRRPLSAAAWQALRDLAGPTEAWRRVEDPAARAEVRQALNDYVTWTLGRRPRLLPYLGS
jgi:DNA repair protein RecO (recombination protein O)